MRLNGFDLEAAAANLDDADSKSWRNRLAAGALTDEEHGQLQDELALTPSRVVERIEDKLETGSVDLADLVPTERRYYEHALWGRSTIQVM